MGKIYGSCYCTITATAASDSEKGLFNDRPAAKGSIYPVQVLFMLNGEEPLGTYFCADSSSWKRNVDDAILNRRGWVVQERQLAPRTIHFAREQIFWECRQASASESFPSGKPDVATIMPDEGYSPQLRPPREMIRALDRLREVKYSGKRGVHRLAEAEDVTAAKDVYLAWARLIERYSNWQLTKEGDKLIAVSGIARLLQDLLEDEYLAGLWRKQLHYHLMWYLGTRRENDVAPTKPRHWRAPSWSWASIDGRLYLYYWNLEEKAGYYDGEVVRLIEIIEAKTFYQTGDPTGQVLGGYVKIKSSLSQAKSFAANVSPNDVKWAQFTLRSTITLVDYGLKLRKYLAKSTKGYREQ